MPELKVEVTYDVANGIDEATLRTLLSATLRGVATHLSEASLATAADEKRELKTIVTGITEFFRAEAPDYSRGE